MKLSKLALEKINKHTRLKLAIALDYTSYWVNKLYEANKDNGPLTTAKALAVIRLETGLTDEEILVEDTVTVG